MLRISSQKMLQGQKNRMSNLEPLWRGSFTVILSTAVKVEVIVPWFTTAKTGKALQTYWCHVSWKKNLHLGDHDLRDTMERRQSCCSHSGGWRVYRQQKSENAAIWWHRWTSFLWLSVLYCHPLLWIAFESLALLFAIPLGKTLLANQNCERCLVVFTFPLGVRCFASIGCFY